MILAPPEAAFYTRTLRDSDTSHDSRQPARTAAATHRFTPRRASCSSPPPRALPLLLRRRAVFLTTFSRRGDDANTHENRRQSAGRLSPAAAARCCGSTASSDVSDAPTNQRPRPAGPRTPTTAHPYSVEKEASRAGSPGPLPVHHTDTRATGGIEHFNNWAPASVAPHNALSLNATLHRLTSSQRRYISGN